MKLKDVKNNVNTFYPLRVVCIYHCKLLSEAGRNTVISILSKITLITHKHDGNIITGHILGIKGKYIYDNTTSDDVILWCRTWKLRKVVGMLRFQHCVALYVHICLLFTNITSKKHHAKLKSSQDSRTHQMHAIHKTLTYRLQEGGEKHARAFSFTFKCIFFTITHISGYIQQLYLFGSFSYNVQINGNNREAKLSVTSIMSTHSLTFRKLFSQLTSYSSKTPSARLK